MRRHRFQLCLAGPVPPPLSPSTLTHNGSAPILRPSAGPHPVGLRSAIRGIQTASPNAVGLMLRLRGGLRLRSIQAMGGPMTPMTVMSGGQSYDRRGLGSTIGFKPTMATVALLLTSARQ